MGLAACSAIVAMNREQRYHRWICLKVYQSISVKTPLFSPQLYTHKQTHMHVYVLKEAENRR